MFPVATMDQDSSTAFGLTALGLTKMREVVDAEGSEIGIRPVLLNMKLRGVISYYGRAEVIRMFSSPGLGNLFPSKRSVDLPSNGRGRDGLSHFAIRSKRHHAFYTLPYPASVCRHNGWTSQGDCDDGQIPTRLVSLCRSPSVTALSCSLNP
jgi:hypothetical protein